MCYTKISIAACTENDPVAAHFAQEAILGEEVRRIAHCRYHPISEDAARIICRAPCPCLLSGSRRLVRGRNPLDVPRYL